MPITTSTLWSAPDTQAVALIQNAVNGAKIILNGKLADPVTHSLSFLNSGYTRNVSISSTVDNSATSSVIVGYVNGLLLSETVVNPNNSTSYSDNTFDKIISITITGGNANNISYGTGNQGYVFLPVSIVSGRIPQPSVQIIVMGDDIDYTVYNTLDNSVQGNGQSYQNLIANGTFLVVGEHSNEVTSIIVSDSVNLLLNSYLIEIIGNATTSLKIIYVQL